MAIHGLLRVYKSGSADSFFDFVEHCWNGDSNLGMKTPNFDIVLVF